MANAAVVKFSTVPLVMAEKAADRPFREGSLVFHRDSREFLGITDGNGNITGSGAIDTEATSRELTAGDDGTVIECTATITITVPIGLPNSFACAVIPSGTTTIASSGGALINGATSNLTRAAVDNAMFAIQARASAANSYVVTGT